MCNQMEVRKSDLYPSTGRVSAVHHIFNKRLNSAINEIKTFELQENAGSSSCIIVSLSGTSILSIYQKLSHSVLQNFFYYCLKRICLLIFIMYIPLLF